MENKTHLKNEPPLLDLNSIPSEIKEQIQKCFPVYFSDDLEERKEEVCFSSIFMRFQCSEWIQELRRLIDEYSQDPRYSLFEIFDFFLSEF